MPYSRDPAKVETIRAELEILLDRRSCRWTVPAGSASSWAFRLREARAILREQPQIFPALAVAIEDYTFEILDDHTVQARIRYTSSALPALSLSDARLHEIVGHAIGLWEQSVPLRYPRFQLQANELSELCLLIKPWGYAALVLADELTLMPADPHLEPFYIKPESSNISFYFRPESPRAQT